MSLWLLISGCSFGGSNEPREEKKVTLKAAVPSPDSFRFHFAQPYEAAHPNVTFSVVQIRGNWKDFLVRESPDLILCSMEDYETLSR